MARMTPEERKAQLDAAHETLTKAIDELVSPEAWQAMIEARLWLRKYSLRNLMMILAQCPGATDVRPYGNRRSPQEGSWLKVGRHAVKGSSALRIYAPLLRKEVNPATGKEREVLYGWKLVPVFDVSQTDGDPLPEVPEIHAELLTGQAPEGLWEKAAKLVVDLGYTLHEGVCPDAPEANGVTVWGPREVWVRTDRDDAQRVKTLVHEIAHIMCGHEDREITRSRGEIEAESVAHHVVRVAGMVSSPYSVPYVAGWATSREEIEESAKTVLKTADEVIKRLGL